MLTIKSLKTHKRPGPDRFFATYFKRFSDFLAPVLVRAFNAILVGHTFCSEMLTAAISLLPKPQTDDSSWSKYRPICLLNLDIKLLAKILATKLNHTIGSLIMTAKFSYLWILERHSTRSPGLICNSYFGDRDFLSWISALYANPTVFVRYMCHKLESTAPFYPSH